MYKYNRQVLMINTIYDNQNKINNEINKPSKFKRENIVSSVGN